MKLSLRLRLMAIVTLVIIAMAVVGWRGVAGIQGSNRTLNAIYEQQVIPSMMTMEVKMNIISLNRTILNHIVVDNAAEKKPREERAALARSNVTDLLSRLSRTSGLSDRDLEFIKEIRDKLNSTLPFQETIFGLSRENRKEEAASVLHSQLRPIVNKLDELINEFVELRDKALNDAMQSEHDRYHREFNIIISIIIVAIILSLLISFYFANSIATRIIDGMNVLSSTASEIVSTTSQLASNASETAVSANETTTTVEEVRQTANVSTQKAKNVSESAQKATQIAKAGKKAVEDTMEGMSGIKQKMESVAESIVTLSEQSQAIGEIIATVDDIAEQTNLLAVNASIEAVKAGEQGKGFSVVAQEIKALADQSKQATKRVRTILNDIQKATGKAVMATEEGSKTVDIGSQLSIQSSEAIQALADAIAEAAQAATQIAASNQQQFVGMDQVATAMETVKIATTQNASGAKQLEEAAQNLSDLGKRLKEMVT